ncbi:hypothetical protein Y88_0068 [Novosphingobium nitrogenifigens DSM 19370]|uniref:Uncharacterized protein n=1 Tax=Novosphingobium nitrogenifigens DSM 19370 TaxID=983920 RepID=F1Z4P3_9SPHN|nr:hypothetical protein [Novosphingobium nitrogenifigens]EGD60420.1 hypothetical protein Y88_0068 [Novosphingobium nitrogenifigens DSM 19370]
MVTKVLETRAVGVGTIPVGWVQLPDGSYALQVSATNPDGSNIGTGSGGGSNASVGAIGTTAPTSATSVGITDGSGNLRAVSTAPGAQGSTGTNIAASGPLGIYNTAAPSLSNGQYSALQLDSASNLKTSLQTALPPGTNMIGSVVGRPSQISPAITVTAGTYATGNVVGGVLTLPAALDATDLCGILQDILIVNKATSGNTCSWSVALFNANPSGSTFTDKAAPVIATADMAKLLGVFSVSALSGGNVLGSAVGIAQADAIGAYVIGASTTLYAVLIVTGTPTFGTTSDVSLMLRIMKG